MEVLASVFSHKGVDFLGREGISSIKFPFSMVGLFRSLSFETLTKFSQIYVSTDTTYDLFRIQRVSTLYCISEYPVRFHIDWEGIFPRFDGFSSHCLGIEQDVRAVQAGAKIIEKHFTLDSRNIHCPDHQFALRPSRLKEFVQQCRSASPRH